MVELSAVDVIGQPAWSRTNRLSRLRPPSHASLFQSQHHLHHNPLLTKFAAVVECLYLMFSTSQIGLVSMHWTTPKMSKENLSCMLVLLNTSDQRFVPLGFPPTGQETRPRIDTSLGIDDYPICGEACPLESNTNFQHILKLALELGCTSEDMLQWFCPNHSQVRIDSFFAPAQQCEYFPLVFVLLTWNVGSSLGFVCADAIFLCVGNGSRQRAWCVPYTHNCRNVGSVYCSDVRASGLTSFTPRLFGGFRMSLQFYAQSYLEMHTSFSGNFTQRTKVQRRPIIWSEFLSKSACDKYSICL